MILITLFAVLCVCGIIGLWKDREKETVEKKPEKKPQGYSYGCPNCGRTTQGVDGEPGKCWGCGNRWFPTQYQEVNEEYGFWSVAWQYDHEMANIRNVASTWSNEENVEKLKEVLGKIRKLSQYH